MPPHERTVLGGEVVEAVEAQVADTLVVPFASVRCCAGRAVDHRFAKSHDPCSAGASATAGCGNVRRGSVPFVDDDALFALIPGAEHQTFGPVEIDIIKVGEARVKRSIYPVGMRWSADLAQLVGTDTCRHAHVGFLAHGSLHFEYPDGCSVDVVAPAGVDIAPGHDAWVVSSEPAVLIELDFEGDTVARLGVAGEHRH